MRVAALLLIALGACKESPAPPPATPVVAAPAPAAADARVERPSEPTTVDTPVLGPPLSVEDAKAALPALDGKEMLPLRQTSDKRQVHATWCIDGDAADDVARKVEKQMAAAGYTGLVIRGDARKAGVTGERAGFRMSMVVSGSSAATCQAPKHYFASATIFRL